MSIRPNLDLKPMRCKPPSYTPPTSQITYYANCRSCGAPRSNSRCEYCETSSPPAYTQKQFDTHVRVAVLEWKLFGEPRIGLI